MHENGEERMQSLQKTLQRISQERGGVAHIHSVFIDFPSGIAAHYDFYSQLMLQENLPLSRVQREFLAAETSRMNRCSYCIHHHQAAYDHLLQNNSPEQNYALSVAEKEALSALAYTLTIEPNKASPLREKFLQSGFSTAQWQHAIFIVSYFNFSNRLALAMDLQLEDDFQQTCR